MSARTKQRVATPRAAAAPSHHPFVEGLLAALPAPGSQWPVQKRVAWLQTAAYSFGIIYEGEGDIQVHQGAIAPVAAAAAEEPREAAETRNDERPRAAVATLVPAKLRAQADELLDGAKAEFPNTTVEHLWKWMNRHWPELSQPQKEKIFMVAKEGIAA